MTYAIDHVHAGVSRAVALKTTLALAQFGTGAVVHMLLIDHYPLGQGQVTFGVVQLWVTVQLFTLAAAAGAAIASAMLTAQRTPAPAKAVWYLSLALEAAGLLAGAAALSALGAFGSGA